MTTQRKPYVRTMDSRWWTRLGFYRFYMLREGTAVPAVWFSLELLYGLFALKHGPENWAGFVDWLANPLVLALNLIALAAALLHSKTWFDLVPKAAIVVVKDEKLPPAPIITAMWAVFIVASVGILSIAFFY
ncbi:fumarate reductase subunit FrdC [Biostraticola tofi]|uniref:Fumarate reductase subunit C n=1 Tax=Biostraticola tofi TaxID=466109 RepID=A0A4R3Z6M7_9GAMM|nr:fumarate reductase subunit FrdC [Biostraticola tofi]TCW00145.1 fumarate reductase subunit C [Biostraticola tofi]